MSKETEKTTTRAKILATALQLFNERGQRNVTTAQIAKELNISEGNLWYHFRTQQDLINELYLMLEQEVDGNLSRVPLENASLADHLNYLSRAFEYLWEFRFLFSDRFEYLNNDEFINRIQTMTRRGQQNAERILADMTACKMLVATPEEARALAINAWILHSNWIGFLQARENITEITEEHIKEGFAQMMALFNPYWSQQARGEATKLLAEFSPSVQAKKLDILTARLTG